MKRPRVSVYLGASLDLRIAREDGRVDWLEQFHDASVGDYGYAAFFATVDTLLIGRATYDMVSGFPQWPYEGKRVVVVTHRPVAPRENVETAEGRLSAVLERLASRGAKHVYLDGGQVVRQGLAEDVVDTLTLSLVPLVLGSGRALFENGLPTRRFSLLGAQSFPTGLVQLRYQRADSAADAAGR